LNSIYKKKIAIIVNVIPNYRETFYKKIINNKNYDVTIFAQKDLPTSLKTVENKFKKNLILCKYFSIGDERLVFTLLPFTKLLKNFDIFIVEGNPRYVSHFLLATLLLILKKKIILWIMAHSCNNNQFREKIRLSWSKLFKYLFVYTDREKLFLKKKNFKKNVIYAMNNGLDQDKIGNIKKKLKNKKIRKKFNHKYFLSCARLIKKNKFEIAIKAFAEIKKTNNNFTWYIIGDGDQKKNLKNLVYNYNLYENVKFLGSIYNEKKLAPYFLMAECLIHPASIGLTLNHAFGYGLPVITHSSRQFHNPEIAAFKNNSTGLLFIKDNITSLKNAIKKFLYYKNLKQKFSINCYQIVKTKYNINEMVNNFFKIVKKLEI
jgi:glycosyltransferase involved in cell wall biosynthesis